MASSKDAPYNIAQDIIQHMLLNPSLWVKTRFHFVLPLLASSNVWRQVTYGDKADQGYSLKGSSHRQHLFSLSQLRAELESRYSSCSSGDWCGREAEEEGHEETRLQLLCLCFILSPSGTDFSCITRAPPTAATKPLG